MRIPSELPLWQAALLGCGVVTAMGAVRNVARVQPGDSVAVLGCGGVGLQVDRSARLAGADPIIALDSGAREARARARARRHTCRGRRGGRRPRRRHFAAVRRRRRLCIRGHRAARDDPLARGTAIRPGGTAVVVGLVPDGVEATVPAIEFLSDKSLVGTYYGSGDPAAELPGLAELALAGEIDLGVVTHVERLDGVEAALDRLRRGEGARTVLIVDDALAGYTERDALRRY